MTLKALFDEFVDLTHIGKTSIIYEIYHNFESGDVFNGICAVSSVRDWRTTPEGRLFWLDKCLKWQFYCLINAKRVKVLQNFNVMNCLSDEIERYPNFAPEVEATRRKKIASALQSWQIKHKKRQF